jgi:hypothetical protein
MNTRVARVAVTVAEPTVVIEHSLAYAPGPRARDIAASEAAGLAADSGRSAGARTYPGGRPFPGTGGGLAAAVVIASVVRPAWISRRHRSGSADD